MSRIYRFLGECCWLLGVLCVVLGVVLKFAPTVGARGNLTGRGGVAFGGVMFLCSLASRELGRGTPASS